MNKFTGLQFLLTYGAFVRIMVPEEEAKQIIAGWQQGSLKPIIAGTNQYGSWAIKVEQIQGIHTVDTAPQPVQPGAIHPPGLLRPGASGI